MDIVIVGAGAAGYFAAIHAAEANPQARVHILEAAKPLAKVAISGGGRCNVTTSITDVRQLLEQYPRGHKELFGPFKRFGPEQTRAWFEQRGVALKTEADGRVFPCSDSSQSIIDCLQDAAREAGVRVLLKQSVQSIKRSERFHISTKTDQFDADKVILCCGGSKHGHTLAATLGHKIITPVPSIFTFRIQEAWLHKLSGLSTKTAQVRLSIADQTWQHQGPCLITHWGLSGPCILRLSAFAARAFHDAHYQAQVCIDWSGAGSDAIKHFIEQQRQQHGKAKIINSKIPRLPQRLAHALLKRAGINDEQRWSTLSKQQQAAIIEQTSACPLAVKGKSTFKEEFVTAGGIARDEIDWRSMHSKCCPGLYAAGELLDVDGVTGGFNFQNAWTTAYLAGTHAALD